MMVPKTGCNLLTLPNIDWSVTDIIQNIYSGYGWPVGFVIRVKIKPFANSLNSSLVLRLFLGFRRQFFTKCFFKLVNGCFLGLLDF